ncbi:MAG: hypothetical protein HYY84_14660 [Deltaproteobacteria bacterium]|nr:hypothetical protein [Deltaproteobacteria bacterium]
MKNSFSKSILGLGTVAALLVAFAPLGARAEGNPDKPVVRAEPSNWGMTFSFGGLATLATAGDTRTAGTIMAGSTVGVNVGMKYVSSETLHIPFYFGTTIVGTKILGTDLSATWGLGFGVGLQKYFRLWRRIAPFIDAYFNLNVSDPTGASNLTFTLGLSPGVGVEYYIGDKVSLAARYMFNIGLNIGGDAITNTYIFATGVGGAATLTFYF